MIKFTEICKEILDVGVIITKAFCPIIKKFEETSLVKSKVTWNFSFTVYTNVIGETTTREEEWLDKLRWL